MKTRDNDSILVDMDGVDFKLAFKAAVIFTLGQRQPFVSALVKEADLKRAISAAARQLNSDEKELKKARKEVKELQRSLDSERMRSNGLEDELEDSGKAYAQLRDSTDAQYEEKADLRERLDYEIDQCRETMRALRESEARARGAERELAELRISHEKLLRKHEKIMNILKDDEDDDIPPEDEDEDEEFDKTQTISEVPLVVTETSEPADGRRSRASDMSLSDEEESKSEVASTLAGSFARISLRPSPSRSSTTATSQSDDSEEEEETSPVFLREMAQQHKICSDNFLDRARSAEKWGDLVAAEKRRTEADQYAKLAQHYNKLAATKVFHRNNPHLHNGAFVASETKKDGPKGPTHIDVHHLLRQEALDYVQSHIDLCKSVGLEHTIVICGRGNHSPKGSPVLRNAILDDLEKLSHTGLKASLLERNPGRIFVTWNNP